MNISPDDWKAASGSYVEDDSGELWRLIGFIDRPAMILSPIKMAGAPHAQLDGRSQMTVIMGSEQSKQFHLLKRA